MPELGAALLLLQGAAAQEPTVGQAVGLSGLLGRLNLVVALRALVTVLVGTPLVLLASRWARSWMSARMHRQAGLLTGKLVLYAGLSFLVILTLSELGFSLAPLLGAAGVLGVALGFASQTSVSNLISGLFLLAERPFVLDDLIEVGGVTGRVVSIDTLSVQLRTFDNRMVRIPNETLVKSQMINITRFPIRRVDVRVAVAWEEDASRIREILLDVADRNPNCLMEPAPVVVFEGFGESSMNFLLGVWAIQANFHRLRNGIQEDLKARFDAEGVRIPAARRTIYVTPPASAVGAGAPEPREDGGPGEAGDAAAAEEADEAAPDQRKLPNISSTP